jgi:hypothetical protein
MQLRLAKQRLDRSHGAHFPTDLNPVADLERPFTREVTGRDDLIAATQFVPVIEGRHRTANDMRGQWARSCLCLHIQRLASMLLHGSSLRTPQVVMLILAVHETPTLTRERYEQVVRRFTNGESRIESASDLPFDRVLVSAAGEGPNGFCIFEVFESETGRARSEHYDAISNE